jgi:hypothetical protein
MHLKCFSLVHMVIQPTKRNKHASNNDGHTTLYDGSNRLFMKDQGC